MPSSFRFGLLAKAGYHGPWCRVPSRCRTRSFLRSDRRSARNEVSALDAASTALRPGLGRIDRARPARFVAWRLAQSLADSDGHGSDRKGLIVRSALFGSAVVYLGLAGYSLGHALFLAGGNQESARKGWRNGSCRSRSARIWRSRSGIASSSVGSSPRTRASHESSSDISAFPIGTVSLPQSAFTASSRVGAVFVNYRHPVRLCRIPG